MIFLIHYDRRAGYIVELRSFSEANRADANKARLDLELGLLTTITDNEVVILEAPDENALRVTHSRYFDDLLTMFESAKNAIDARLR